MRSSLQRIQTAQEHPVKYFNSFVFSGYFCSLGVVKQPGVKFTAHIILVPRLRMSRTTPLLPVYAFMICTETLRLLPGWCSGDSVDLCSGDDRFEPSSLEPPLSRPRVFMLVPRVCYDSFLPNLFQFTIHQSLYHRRYMDLVWETDRVWTDLRIWNRIGAVEKGSIVLSDWRFERKGSLWKRVSVRIILKWILIKVPNNCILSAVWRAWNVLCHPEGRARMGGEVCENRWLKSTFWPRNKEARITPRNLINDQTIICIIHHTCAIMGWNKKKSILLCECNMKSVCDFCETTRVCLL